MVNHTKSFTKRLLLRQREQSNTNSTRRKLRCPSGMIERRGYVRKFNTSVIKKGYTVRRKDGREYRIFPEKSSVHVKPICVKDRGLPGKLGPGEGFGPLKKGELKKHGYAYIEPTEIRRAALKKAIEEFGAIGVYHKLDAVYKLSKRTVPAASKVFKSDRNWVKEML
jgi:hypothetical protein